MSGGLAGKRVLISGAARGIGAATARRLHERGARVALAGIETESLAQVAAACGDAPWFSCDVTDAAQVDAAVTGAVEALGGLDVVVANAGVASQIVLAGGDAELFERTIAVNLVGTYHLINAAGPHVAHPSGYVLLTASLAAAVHAPLMGAYNASKAAVEALGNTLRMELAPAGARVGVAYYAQIETDMTSRGFGTEAAAKLAERVPLGRHLPLERAVDAIVAGIERRARRIVAPRWVAAVLPVRMAAQRVVELATRRSIRSIVEIARDEPIELTTPQD